MDTFITSRATQHEVNSLDKRLKMLLSRKRLNHNPKGIEGFSTLGTPNTDDIPFPTVDLPKLENTEQTDEATDYADTYEEYVKTQKEKWTNAFAFLTKADLKKPSEWHNVIKGIVYAFPISVEIIVDEFADSMPVLPEGGTVSQYYKNREDDKKFLKESVYEFGYVLVSMYISHMLYTRIYTGNDLEHVSEAWNFSFIPGLKHLIDTELFVYYQLAPEILETFVTVIVPIIIQLFVYSNYFSLRIFALFIVSYFLTYYFFDIIVKMFMQSVEAIFGMLSFKFQTGSTPFTYAMIMGGLAKYLINPVNLFYVFSSTSMTFGIYLAFFFLHLITTIVFAPFCQLIFVFYVMYVMFGGPSDIGKLVLSWFVKTVQSFFKDVEVDVAQSNASNPEEIFGGFDLLSYKYGYTYFFFFIMLLFFFFKTIQSAVDLKTTSIRTAVSTSNAYITATMLVIYLAKYFTNEPVKRQEFSIGKKPVAKEEPESDSEDSDLDVESVVEPKSDSDGEPSMGATSVVENIINKNFPLQNVLALHPSPLKTEEDTTPESLSNPKYYNTTPNEKKKNDDQKEPYHNILDNQSSQKRRVSPLKPPKRFDETPESFAHMESKKRSDSASDSDTYDKVLGITNRVKNNKPKSKLQEVSSFASTGLTHPSPPTTIKNSNTQDNKTAQPPSTTKRNFDNESYHTNNSSDNDSDDSYRRVLNRLAEKHANSSQLAPTPPSPSVPTSPTSTTSQTAVTSTSTSTSEEVPPPKLEKKILPDQSQKNTIEKCGKCGGEHKTNDCPWNSKEREINTDQPIDENKKKVEDYVYRLATQDGEWGNELSLRAFTEIHLDVTVIVHREDISGNWTSRKVPDTEDWREKVIHIKHVILPNKPCTENCNHYILLKPTQKFKEGETTFEKDNFKEIYTITNGSCMFDAITEGLKDPNVYEHHDEYDEKKKTNRKDAYFETRKEISSRIKTMYNNETNPDAKFTMLVDMDPYK